MAQRPRIIGVSEEELERCGREHPEEFDAVRDYLAERRRRGEAPEVLALAGVPADEIRARNRRLWREIRAARGLDG
jgi:hypothetical protein